MVDNPYFQLQEKVFEHLYKRHLKDPLFTFSVRRKFGASSGDNIFTGTDKSGYFSFTLWFFPCYYPGAATEAAIFRIYKINNNSFSLGFQFYTKRDPSDEPNAATLALGPEIHKRASAAKMDLILNDADNIMYKLRITKRKSIPLHDFTGVLDEFIDEITSIVQPSIVEVKKNYPQWHDGVITKAEFDTNIQRICQRFDLSFPPTFPLTTSPEKGGSPQFWWLNFDPTIFKLEGFAVEHEDFFTSYNAEGNKRQGYQNFTQLTPGDLLIAYETESSKRIKAILEVTQSLHTNPVHQEIFTFKIKEFVQHQAEWHELKDHTDLSQASFIENKQGSLFQLTQSEFEMLYKLCQSSTVLPKPYTLQEADQELFLDLEAIQKIQTSLKRKKNVILQGSPGVGKTYFAKRLAYLQMGSEDESRVEMIQFHQSYSYEDFIRGFRPTSEGKFTLANGIFYDFCLRAQKNPQHDYFFIIDEINRGNLSKIFGELLMLLEADKRGPKFSMALTYRKEDEPKFYVPENVYIIGTMNTADRSLAMVDYALRRRFSFFDLTPKYDDKFIQFIQKDSSVDATLALKIATALTALNINIEKDKDLGKGFLIGHSYFCVMPSTPFDGKDWYAEIVDQEITPLIQEYWYDNEAKVKEAITLLTLS